MEFRRLDIHDLDACFASRLRALQHAPTAFVTTLAEETARGPGSFAHLLDHRGDDKVIFGAVSDKEILGTIGIRREERAKTHHKAYIWGMYVDLDQQRQGIGGRLLDLAVEHACVKMGVAAVYLSLLADNDAARRLYESRGFVVWGREPRALSDKDCFFDELHMALIFDKRHLARRNGC